MSHFKKILVANRGEIACRVFKTAKRMGIGTVAVYSDADKRALHVSMSDEAVHIGPAAATESYLVIDKIIDACKQTGADAVHPGYGFLSERAEFSERLKDEGITFLGPDRFAIDAMGDKITSKKLAAEAGVSVVPGYMGLIEDAEACVKIANEIGYPVMIKASAGGGGKGMRIAWNDTEAREGFERSKSEAASSFGDDRIFVEKFVTQPRHIEIQVLADKHGNCLYLGERECSIQRRNQKVIEEAPSPFLDEATRKAMGEQAVALSKAVDYCSAGTVEFIVDGDKNFYFLEMNTRLQVEHPVTELITGVDLVEQMIRVGAGEKLSLTQDDIKLNGWAMESRLYAEDPYRNFMPSTGRLTRYRPPNEDGKSVRNDTGVFEGGEISVFYDPMIAKLCTWAPTRLEAIDGMKDALNAFEIEGIGHNLPFLSAVMDQDRFRSGTLTTAYIEEEFPDGFKGVEPTAKQSASFAQIALALHSIQSKQQNQVIGDAVVVMDHQILDAASSNLEVDWSPEKSFAFIQQDGKTTRLKVQRLSQGYRLRVDGMDLTLIIMPRHAAELLSILPEKTAPDTSNLLLCPMPGLVADILVKEGDAVEEGQALAIVEAMKMENVLKAEKSATVKTVSATVGDTLAVDDTILVFA